MVSILPALLRGSVYANSEAYVAPPRFSPRRVQFHPIVSSLIPTRPPREVSVMCIAGPSMVQGFVSNACRCTVTMAHKRLLKCVADAVSRSSPLRQLIGLLPRCRDMETLVTPKHPTPPRCHYHSPPTHFGLDAWRGPAGVHQEEPRCRSTWTRGSPFCCFYPRLTPVTSYSTSLRVSATFTPVM